jgi:tetratricopeptide (TPR) repeat protein
MKNYAQARFHYRKASHLSPDDSKLYYKIACTYFNEGQWTSAIKQLESAMRIHRQQSEYNLLMGECKLQMGQVKEAVQYFSVVVRVKPKNTAGWEALIRALYQGEYFSEARQQSLAALENTNNKPVFYYYLSASLFSLAKPKEALLYLEKALQLAPKKLNLFVALHPSILQNPQVVDLVARYKRGKGK